MGEVRRGFLKSWIDTSGRCLARQILIKTFVQRICRTLVQCLLAINLHTHFFKQTHTYTPTLRQTLSVSPAHLSAGIN